MGAGVPFANSSGIDAPLLLKFNAWKNCGILRNFVPMESTTPLDQRFLMISTVLSDSLITEMDTKVIPESLARLKQRGVHDASITTASAAYFSHQKSKNEITCFTLYAYDDIPIGKRFDVVFDALKSGKYCIAPLILTQIVLLLGDFFPMTEIGRGHKHFCTFDCPDGIPKLLLELKKLTDFRALNLDSRLGATDFESWAVLQRIYGSTLVE